MCRYRVKKVLNVFTFTCVVFFCNKILYLKRNGVFKCPLIFFSGLNKTERALII